MSEANYAIMVVFPFAYLYFLSHICVLFNVPCVFLETNLLRGRQGQDDQHGEQGQGEALVGVPGLQGRRGTGQEEVTHWREGGRTCSEPCTAFAQPPATGSRLPVPGWGLSWVLSPLSVKGWDDKPDRGSVSGHHKGRNPTVGIHSIDDQDPPGTALSAGI